MIVEEIERFGQDLRREYGAHGVIPLRTERCRIRLQLHDFGPFQCSIAAGQFVRFTRSHSSLDNAWHDSIFVIQQLTGSSRITHYGRSARLAPNDMAVVDSIGPCSTEYVDGPAQALSFPVPRAAASDLTRVIRDSSQWIISGRTGMGRTLASLLNAAATPAPTFDCEDQHLMTQTVISFLNRCILAPGAPCASDDKRIFARMRSWVLENLASPELSPNVLASEFALSRRQLYRLFEQLATTPAAWIWNLRLNQAYSLLSTDCDAAITEVAFAVGFKDAAHFSRAFRRRYGRSPNEVRPGQMSR